MTPASHPISLTIPGYGLYDGRCLPCSGMSGAGAYYISPSSSRSNCKSLLNFKNLPLTCISRGVALSVCNSYSGGQERNKDFSRDKQPYFRNRKNRQNEESDDLDSDEDEFLLSKNGPLLSDSAKRSTTETPGGKEKEIVEIFKKVQQKLRERALKDEKKVEESQVQNKKTETVDSLINLLRQHSGHSGKQINHNGIGGETKPNQRKENGPVVKDKTKMSNGPVLKGRSKTSSGSNNRIKNLAEELLEQPEEEERPVPDENLRIFLGSKGVVKPAAQESKGVSVSRPVSNFQRRSPVPQVRYDPVNSRVNNNDSYVPLTNINGKRKKAVFEPKSKAKPEPELELELEAESFLDDEGLVDKLLDEEASEKDEIASHDLDDVDDVSDNDDEEEEEYNEQIDYSGMKLAELRALAKSRGMKGFSKLKKQELVELLASASI